MVESSVLASVGALIGIAWASLATYLGSLVHPHSERGMLAIRAIFLTISLLVHGYVRSSTPRLFILVLLMVFPVVIGLTTPVFVLDVMFAKQFFFPILTASVIVILVNVVVLPEYGSTYLGTTTIETLQETLKIQKDAIKLFLAYANHPTAPAASNPLVERKVATTLRDLAGAKARLREKVSQCKGALTECSFELTFSVLAPWELKPIAAKGIKKLVANTVCLVGACESKYALLGDAETGETRGGVENKDKKKRGPREELNIGTLRRKRETEYGDKELFQDLLERVEVPLNDLQVAIEKYVDIINTCVAYTYDVPMLSSSKQGAGKPQRPEPQELDTYIDLLGTSIVEFGERSTEALERAANKEISGAEIANAEVDVMPRDEIFLISSFLLNLRQAASNTLDMLRESRELVELHEERKRRRRLWFPRIKLRKWLFTGVRERESMPAVRRDSYPREGDLETYRETPSGEPRDRGRKETHRERLANFLEWIVESDDMVYAFKLTFGVMLVSWPAFVSGWETWFYLNRGLWAGFIIILVFENTVGSTVWTFAMRAIGTTLGSVWGYAAYEARDGNEYVIAVMIMLGAIPGYYVQLGTAYMKAGMICTISMCVVAVSTHLRTVPGSSQENFTKRLATMLIGGVVATLVQTTIFPAKARVRLKESLASAIVQISTMEACISYGVDDARGVIPPQRTFQKFARASKKAEASLSSAETFLGYTKQEPRLKGSFKQQEVVYKEIIFVLRQIAERMENTVRMYGDYGCAIHEQYHSQVYGYRRNVAACIALMLFACHEALTTKLPLPQFLPSARLAHLRMLVRVRQVLLEEDEPRGREKSRERGAPARRRALQLKFLSWNASTAALGECIEYIEELVDLLKMLVGANEFRSGLLNRPTYMEYVEEMRQQRTASDGQGQEEDRKAVSTATGSSLIGMLVRIGSKEGGESDPADIPNPLRRIHSRRVVAKSGKHRIRTRDRLREEGED